MNRSPALLTRNALVYLANRGRLLIAVTVGNYVGCAIIFGILERHGFFRSLWWSIVTGYTIGYRDVFPQTDGGRLLGVWLIITASLLSLLTGAYIVLRLMIDTDEWSHEEQEEMKREQRETRAELREVRTELAEAHAGLHETRVQLTEARTELREMRAELAEGHRAIAALCAKFNVTVQPEDTVPANAV